MRCGTCAKWVSRMASLEVPKPEPAGTYLIPVGAGPECS